MVVRFGMTQELGQVSYEPETTTYLAGSAPIYRPRTYADQTAASIDQAIKTLIDMSFLRAKAILAQNSNVLVKCAEELLERETLGTDDLSRLAGGLKRAKAIEHAPDGAPAAGGPGFGSDTEPNDQMLRGINAEHA